MRQGSRARLQISIFTPVFPAEDRGQGQGGLHRNHSARSIFIVGNKTGAELTLRARVRYRPAEKSPFWLLHCCGAAGARRKALGLTRHPFQYVMVLGEPSSPDALAQHRAGTEITTRRHKAAAGWQGVPGGRRFSRRRSGSANEALLIQRDGSSGQR